MPGEQLPPIVVATEGDDSEFLAMLDRDVAALRAAAGEIEGLLAGLDLGAGFAASLSGANIGAINTDEIAQGLSEALGGVGATLGQDVGTELSAAAASAGVEAGAALAEGVAEGASGVGDTIGQGLSGELAGQFAAAGEQAGHAGAEALDAAMAAGTSTIGDELAAHISEQLRRGLDEQAQATMGALGAAMAAGTAGMSAVVGTSLTRLLAAAGLAAATEAGGAAGITLATSIGDAAAGAVGASVSGVAAAIEAPLSDALTQAGGAGGDALVAGIAQGASQGADVLAVKVGQSIQASLETTMTEAGAAAGDAFNAGFAAAEESGAGAGAGGSVVAEFLQKGEQDVEHAAEGLGQNAATAFGKGWQTRNGLIPYGGVMEPDQLINMGKQPDPFVPNPAGGAGSWTRASAVGAQDAAKAAWQAYGDELAGLVITPGQFEKLTDAGVAAWREEVAAQAAVSGEGFVSAFADAVTMGMAGIDWAGLSDVQASALGSAMRGTLTEAVASAEPEVVASAQGVGVAMVESVTEAMAEIPAVAAEEGAAAGSVFARAFSGAQAAAGSIAEGFREQFGEDQQWQAAMDRARALGADFKAVGEDFRAEFAADPQWQTKMAEVRDLGDSIVGGIKGGYSAISDLGSAAVGHARDAFGAIGDFGSAVVAREKQVVSTLGDLGPAMVERARGAFDALSAYAEVNADTIGGKFARALTDSMTAFTGSASAIGESVRLVFSRSSEQAALAGSEAGAAFDLALAEGLAQNEPEAVAAVRELEAQVSAALAAGEDELAQSLMARMDAIQLAANQALDFAGPVQREALVLNGAGDEIVAVFESIYQRGAMLSDGLATAMTDALAGIEANTAGFTAQEMAQWNAFFTTLEARGTQAAYELAASMGSVQGKDLMGLGLGSTGNPMGKAGSEAEGLASDLGGVEKAASGATSGMGGMASMMYGPWGMAAFAAMSILPMLSGAFTSSAVSAADFTQAVGQDSQAVGDNTAAVIQSSLAKSDLSDISKSLGLSQAQLIEYAAGEKNVQDQVAAAYNAKQAALASTTDNEQIHSKAQLEGATAAQDQSQALSAQKASLDATTSAVAAAVQQDAANTAALLAAEQTTQIYNAAVNALGQSMLLQVQQTKMSNQATAEFGSQVLFAESSVSYMNAAMGASVASSRESALTSAEASVGLLNLGTSQTTLNAQLIAGETAYTEAQQGAQAYNTVLTSLNGTTNTLLGTEASFTTTLNGLTTAVKSNGDSLDVNTTKGAANITAITGVATAAQAAAVAVYQSDIANGNASKAYQDATTKLQQEKDAFITAADKAGLNKQAVQQLADELFKLPPSVSTTVNVDTSAAVNNLDSLYGLIDQLQGAGSTLANSLDVTAAKQSAKLAGARASGGPVQAGQIYRVNESGEEGFFTAPADGYIVPHDAMASLGSGGSSLGSPWTGGGGGGGGGEPPQVTVHVYLNSQEISAEVRADVQQYKSHNSITGYT